MRTLGIFEPVSFGVRLIVIDDRFCCLDMNGYETSSDDWSLLVTVYLHFGRFIL